MSQLVSDLIYAYQTGAKTLYYNNTRDGSGDEDDTSGGSADDGCESGACKI